MSVSKRPCSPLLLFFLGGHLLLALSGPAYMFVAEYFYSTPDANIGYGLGLIWAAFWGLPWSLWPFFATDRVSVPVDIGVYTACALLNVALHAGVWVWLLRRERRQQRRETAPR
jgi:hypothetical protein